MRSAASSGQEFGGVALAEVTLIALGPRVIARTTPTSSRTSGDEHAGGPDRLRLGRAGAAPALPPGNPHRHPVHHPGRVTPRAHGR